MLPETWIFYACGLFVLAVPLTLYVRWETRRERKIREGIASGELADGAPRGQHPHIDVSNCIGCQGCTSVCPEGSVLGMVGGKAAVLKPHKCIGHGLCAEACPVGAITMVRATPGVSADLPYLTPDYETSVPGLYIAGELGGLALIKNAVQQGKDTIDAIATKLTRPDINPNGVFDVLIVGAGPAGISASLRAIERKLNYVTIERDSIGGSVSKYPRQKLVMTSPVEFPLSGAIKKTQLSKESLMEFWSSICARDDFHARVGETVDSINKQPDGLFAVATNQQVYLSRTVVLAMGRAGTPRKLGVKGEELPKVMYRLLEADHYLNKNILVVGGGDSAVEAALGLALQRGNQVTISYRQSSFARIKDRNAQRVQQALRNGKLQILFNSLPLEFTDSAARLEVDGKTQELPNDYVWIFAGGVAPNDFLKKAGIAFGDRDVTLEVVQEASSVTT